PAVTIDAADLPGVDQPHALQAAVEKALSNWIEADRQGNELLQATVARLEVTGRHPHPGPLREAVDQLAADWQPTRHAGHIDRIQVRVLPDRDLEALAGSTDAEDDASPTAAAARLLLDLREGRLDPDHPLLKQVQATVSEIDDHREYRGLPEPGDDGATAEDPRARQRNLLDTALVRLLDEMLRPGGSS
ncbi:MAG: hypothetical protein R3336_07125, partial [Phycisphaeraceae bacterium]|nr:hypothetical protein [Phycisphaeraceae bacterium]